VSVVEAISLVGRARGRLNVVIFIAQTLNSQQCTLPFMSPTSVVTSHIGDSSSVSEICARVNERVEKVIAERRKKASVDKSGDQDRGKGAVDQDSQNEGGNTSMQGQLGHRGENAELKSADSDLSG
jgi:hypothetical protein